MLFAHQQYVDFDSVHALIKFFFHFVSASFADVYPLFFSRAKDGTRFWELPECHIKGTTIKYMRIPDEARKHVYNDNFIFSLCCVLQKSAIKFNMHA
jgi:hypothetical protein